MTSSSESVLQYWYSLEDDGGAEVKTLVAEIREIEIDLIELQDLSDEIIEIQNQVHGSFSMS